MGPLENSFTSETHSISSPSLANANSNTWEELAMLFIFCLILEKNNECILHQVAKVTYLARGCITHPLKWKGNFSSKGRRGIFLLLQ